MLQKLIHIDHTPFPGGACAAAAASALDIAQQWAMALLGVSLGVPLAGFAGTLYGLSFRAPLSPLALWVNLVGGTLLASFTAPLAGSAFGLPVAVMAGVAGVIGWGLQFAQPWLLQRRESLLDRTAGKVLGNNDGGKQ